MRLFAVLAIVACWAVYVSSEKGQPLEDPPAVEEAPAKPDAGGPTRVYHPVLRTHR